MAKLRATLLLPLLLLCLATVAAAQARKIVYGGKNPPSAKLRHFAEAVADPKTPQVVPESLPAAGAYFVRLAPRKYILDGDGRIGSRAALHGRPLAFLTTPEGLYGRSLLEILAEIGYEAEDILKNQLGKETVAVIFRYPDGVILSEVRDGRLPDDWEKRVFVPTWENVFALFHRLAHRDAAPGQTGPRALTLTDAELGFVLNFSEAGKGRVRYVPYAGLKAAGGPDWAYRCLLESQLSVFEHFRGNGRTQNELIDPDGTRPERGLREYVGPNRRLSELAEVAVVELGWLSAGPGVGAPPPEPPPAKPATPACAGASPCCCPRTS